MKDSWIDKDEIDELISSFSKENPGPGKSQSLNPGGTGDVFENHSVPLQRMVVSPAPSEAPLVSLPTVIPPAVRGTTIASPFSIDEDDELEEFNNIGKLASEAAQALRALQDVRTRAEQGGLIPKQESTQSEELEEEQDLEKGGEVVPAGPLDRIPLDIEIDSDLSLKNRLAQLASILKKHVDMEEMTVVDQHGFSLFQTEENRRVKQNVVKFVDSIRKVYGSETDARSFSASQLAVDDEKWLCIIPTDGDLEGRFVLKALLRKPLDRPEVYVVVELLNEVLRPEANPEAKS